MPTSLEYLLNRYASKTCTPEEKEELMRLLQESSNDEAVRQLIDKMLVERHETHTMSEQTAQAVLQAIYEADEAPVVPVATAKVRRLPFRRIAAAAVVLLLVAATGWLWLMRTPKRQVATVDKHAVKNDVAPGGNKALLTLANGSVIVLDNAANGIVAQEANAKIVKLKNGELIYAKNDGQPGAPPTTHRSLTFNTLSTPKGGEYHIVLPDGSKVWLNAASAITYPTAFTSDERIVRITGEAYFEVAKVFTNGGAKRVPFIVKIANPATGGESGQVEVLGTHFNVNTYDDEEAIKTTLLEGKVKVTGGKWPVTRGENAIQEVMLQPGEQAVLTSHSPLTTPHSLSINHSPDLDEVMAWKNGRFHFENADIRTVMRQLSRWYDVDVVYKRNTIKDDPLFFEVSRNTNLSDVLKALEIAGGARFKIEDKKIIVL